MDILEGPDGADERVILTYALDGTDYELTWTWNPLAEGWFLDVAQADGTRLLAGVRLVVGTHLLNAHLHTIPELPQGTLTVLTTTVGGDDADPGQFDFAEGGRCQLVYVPFDETVSLYARVKASLPELEVRAVPEE